MAFIRDSLRRRSDLKRAMGRVRAQDTKGCPECGAKGACGTCRGLGRLVQDGSTARVKCFECEGSKRCWLCLGLGKVSLEIREARAEYEKRVERMNDLTKRGHRPTALARILLDTRRALREWDTREVSRLVEEFDRKDPKNQGKKDIERG
jgi:hypothetical protein